MAAWTVITYLAADSDVNFRGAAEKPEAKKSSVTDLFKPANPKK